MGSSTPTHVKVNHLSSPGSEPQYIKQIPLKNSCSCHGRFIYVALGRGGEGKDGCIVGNVWFSIESLIQETSDYLSLFGNSRKNVWKWKNVSSFSGRFFWFINIVLPSSDESKLDEYKSKNTVPNFFFFCLFVWQQNKACCTCLYLIFFPWLISYIGHFIVLGILILFHLNFNHMQ